MLRHQLALGTQTQVYHALPTFGENFATKFVISRTVFDAQNRYAPICSRYL